MPAPPPVSASDGQTPEVDAYEMWRRRERTRRVIMCIAVSVGLVVIALAAVFALQAAQNTGSFEQQAQDAVWQWGQKPK